MNEINYCDVCFNAAVDSNFDSESLSYAGVGECNKGFSMWIRSEDNSPTVLIVSKWDSKLQGNVDIGVYKMKYCPECGRKLIENE